MEGGCRGCNIGHMCSIELDGSIDRVGPGNQGVEDNTLEPGRYCFGKEKKVKELQVWKVRMQVCLA